MSADEDTELRDLVAQTLETNGVLGKIRAQLRASVFLALEEQESVQNKTPFQNIDLKKFLSTHEGRLVTGLVREYLKHFKLDYTLAVFDPESGYGEDVEERGELAREFNIVESEESDKVPLLAEVIKKGTSSRGRQSSTEGGATVETKNKKNSDSDGRTSPLKSTSKEPSLEYDDDSFFDDPIPSDKKSFSDRNSKPVSKDKPSSIPKPASSTGQSSLAGLPSLVFGGQRTGSDMDKDIKQMDQNLADLGVDVPDDDYDDDFDSSNISPFGVTPRSARSNHDVRSIEDEEIEEDMSVAEDLLHSDNSGADDLTTDRTVSPEAQSTAFDYVEDVLLP